MGRISNFGILFPSHPRFAHLKCIWASLWPAFAQLHETRCLVLDREVDSNSCWSWTGARPSSPSTLRRWSRSSQRVCWQHCANVCAVTGVPCRTYVFVPHGAASRSRTISAQSAMPPWSHPCSEKISSLWFRTCSMDLRVSVNVRKLAEDAFSLVIFTEVVGQSPDIRRCEAACLASGSTSNRTTDSSHKRIISGRAAYPHDT